MLHKEAPQLRGISKHLCERMLFVIKRDEIKSFKVLKYTKLSVKKMRMYVQECEDLLNFFIDLKDDVLLDFYW